MDIIISLHAEVSNKNIKLYTYHDQTLVSSVIVSRIQQPILDHLYFTTDTYPNIKLFENVHIRSIEGTVPQIKSILLQGIIADSYILRDINNLPDLIWLNEELNSTNISANIKFIPEAKDEHFSNKYIDYHHVEGSENFKKLVYRNMKITTIIIDKKKLLQKLSSELLQFLTS